MKVRIGVAIGRSSNGIDGLGDIVDALERFRFDSIWIPEAFLAGTLDPVVSLSYAAARAPRLKLGTHIIGPGKNPIALAKSLAQLDRVSGGRLLLTFVAGFNDPKERVAQGLPTGDRTTWFDDELPRLRRWWAGEEVDGLALDSRPVQSPLEVWLGGQVPAALERAGRLADGWLPGAITIEDAVKSRVVVEAAAERAGREISPEHFGINLQYTFADELPSVPPLARGVGDQTDVTAVGRAALRSLIARWVDAGFSKIVVRPVVAPSNWSDELAQLAEAVLDLQT